MCAVLHFLWLTVYTRRQLALMIGLSVVIKGMPAHIVGMSVHKVGLAMRLIGLAMHMPGWDLYAIIRNEGIHDGTSALMI